MNSHGLSILIADDTPATLQLERIILEKQGFNVIECDDGIAVLEVAKTYAIDAAVLDIMMPEMDGYQVVKSLEQSGLRRFPIAFSSAMRMDDVKPGIADAFIQKPFSPKHFAEAVKSLLRSTKEMMMY